MSKIRSLVILIMVLVFAVGLGILLYPFAEGYLVDHKIQEDARDFLSWVELNPYTPDSSENHGNAQDPAVPVIPEPMEPNEYVDLWYAMMN